MSWKSSKVAGHLVLSKFGMLLITVTSGCGSVTKPPKAPSYSSESESRNVLVIGDMQLHHAVGGSIKQQSLMTDRFVDVAVRPAELNLLAGVAAGRLGRFAIEGADPEVTIVLGDGLNVACSGELEQFERLMRGLANADEGRVLPWLMAHGNHDSYLSGMASSYGVRNAVVVSTIPCGMVSDRSRSCGKPVDYAWWSAEESHFGAYLNSGAPSWPAVCGAPDKRSYPVNKHVWLAWYLEQLRVQGARPHSTSQELQTQNLSSEQLDEIAGFYPLTLRADEGTPLGKLNFRATGRWYVPRPGEPKSIYDSFLVQSIESSGARIVLIDTSAGYRGKLAGTTAHLMPDQQRAIIAHVQEAGNLPVILAGHFPLREIKRGPRDVILRAVQAHNQQSIAMTSMVEYWSAHTHSPSTAAIGEGIAELNVGSMTDWPMEAVSRDLGLPLDAPHASAVWSYASSSEIPPAWSGSRVLDRRVLPLRCDGALPQKVRGLGLAYHQACGHFSAAQAIGRGLGIAAPRETTCGVDNLLEVASYVASVSSEVQNGGVSESTLCAAVMASLGEGIQHSLGAYRSYWRLSPKRFATPQVRDFWRRNPPPPRLKLDFRWPQVDVLAE